MKRHFSNRGSPLKCIDFYPTVDHHFRRFMDLGWAACRIRTIDQVVRTFFGLSERSRIRARVDDPLDEAEELQLKCSHYVLIVGEKRSDAAERGPVCAVGDQAEGSTS
jgi:tRNA wybutosine-synthesizing protein 4